MVVSERSRKELYERLEVALGQEQADTMMELVPPLGWGDVVTKADLVAVKADLALVKSELRADHAELRADLEHGLRVVVTALVTANIAAVGLAVGLVELLGR